MYRPVPATLPYTLASTNVYRVYRPVPAIQPCTLASTTGYRVYRPVPAIQPCTLALAIGYIWLQPTGYKSTGRVLATQSLLYSFSPNWLHKLTNIDQWLSKFVVDPSLPVFCQLQFFITGYNWLQSVPAGTGYTAVYTCLNNWLQVTECTGWYWLHSLVHLLQQLITRCTGWDWLHSLVHLLQQLVTECTDWYWLQKKKKKKKKKKGWLNIDQ